MFTHLHVHSQFSLLESSVKIKELVEACAGLGMKTLALTDKYVMSGAVEFYRQARAAGIKPITGCEVCLSRKIAGNSDYGEPAEYTGELPGKKSRLNPAGQVLAENSTDHSSSLAGSRSLSHLTLLVKNQKGYENLCRLVSRSHMRFLPYLKDAAATGNMPAGTHPAGPLPAPAPKTDVRQADFNPAFSPPDDNSLIHIPSIEVAELEKFSEGLVCLSGCSSGELSRLLRAGNKDEAQDFSRRLLEVFEDDFYIEIQRYRTAAYNSSSGHGACSELLLALAEKMKIPVVATNNVHYLKKDDYKIYRCLSKIKLMGTKTDPLLNILDNDEHYLKPYREMARLFNDIPSAITNTGRIAQKCDFDFALGRTVLPHFATPSGESQIRYLEQLCLKGLEYRFGKNPDKKITERLAMELSVIARTGFAGYFLVAADIARFACENKIPICGKGSAAGSLVSYILRISNVDPIENNLYFERFLNEERKDPPDIDIDVSSREREKISAYLRSKYGKNSIARVSSFSTTKPRASIREAGRILNMNKDEIDYLVKAAPDYNRFFTDEKMKQSFKSSNLPILGNPNYTKVLSIAERIGGYVRHTSVHPSAFIVSNSDLSKKIPLTLSETGEIMSQYDMNSIDDLGILKMDLISSLSLGLIADTVRTIKKTRGIHVDMSESAYNDRKVYELMQNGLTLGIFQLESFGIRTLSRKVRPECLNDITLLSSLYRPGPQQSGMVGNFIERKFGREKVSYIHEDLASLLKETYGVILYQEQAMQVAIKIAGYSLSEADTLRKAAFNLPKEQMAARHARFIKGATLKGYDLAVANEAFSLISKFASYGFVKAHAAAYAELSYKTCYLKAHFPAEFISTILTNNSGYYSKMQYIEEARRLGIKIKLPDINESGMDFEACDCGTSIRVPLISVRDLGCAGAGSIINERKRSGRFADFEDFYARAVQSCGISKNAVENLIRIGAFDCFGISGKLLMQDFYRLRSLKKPGPPCKGKSLGTRSPAAEATLDASIFRAPDNYNCPGIFADSAAYYPGDAGGPHRLCGQAGMEDNARVPGGPSLRSCAADSKKFTGEDLTSGCPAKDPGCFAMDLGFKDFSLEEKLEMEAEILGFYVSAHPLECFKQKLKLKGNASQFITRSCDFYKQDIYRPPYLKDIFTAGIVISKRMEKTRDSKNMMFCTMEDEDGMYEAVFFSEAYRKSAKIISKHPFIIIKGRLHFKDNNISVVAKDAVNIASLRKLEDLRKVENIRAGFLSETESPWAV
jgi:DNA polymerase III subunit alpha